jgi:AcrR family transcriptional regulator
MAAEDYPTPKERSEREHEARKEQILDAVEDLLIEEGAANLSMRAVARRISYAPASLYYYYRDKDAVVAAVLERTGRRIGKAIRQATSNADDPVEALRAALHAYIDVALERPALARLVYLMREPMIGNLRAGASERNPNLALVATLLRDAEAANALRVGDIDLAVRCLWIAAQGLVIRLAMGDPAIDRAVLVDRYVELLLAGIGRDSPSAE